MVRTAICLAAWLLAHWPMTALAGVDECLALAEGTDWTEDEQEVWYNTCEGSVAELRSSKDQPRVPIRARFLEQILTEDPWATAIPYHGLHVVGAHVEEPLYLSNVHLPWPLTLDDSCFDQWVTFSDAKLDGVVSLAGSGIAGTLDFFRARFGRALLLNRGTFAEIALNKAHVAGFVDLDDAKVSGAMDADGLQVGSSLFLRKGTFADIVLRGARIDSQLSMRGATVSGTINGNQMRVEESVLLDWGTFAKIRLAHARIGGQIGMRWASVEGGLILEQVGVGSDLFMDDGAAFEKPVNLTFAEIGGNLSVREAYLADLDLTGANVKGDLRLAISDQDLAQWANGSQIVLRNLEVGALQDRPGAWPATVELDGFTYRQLGGWGAKDEADPTRRTVAEHLDWLDRDPTFSPQPFRQLAQVLRESGQEDKADDILFAMKDRMADHAGISWDSAVMFLQRIFVGYGYRPEYALYWVLGLWSLGAVLFFASSEGHAHRRSVGAFAFSLDMLLPVIKLRECHYDIDLTGPVRGYFYVHKLMGYVLALFLVAGLSGLTK